MSYVTQGRHGWLLYSSKPMPGMPSLYLNQPHPHPISFSPRPTSFFLWTKSQDSAIRNKNNKNLSKYLCLISVRPGGSMRRCSRNRTTKFTTRLGFPSPTFDIYEKVRVSVSSSQNLWPDQSFHLILSLNTTRSRFLFYTFDFYNLIRFPSHTFVNYNEVKVFIPYFTIWVLRS